MWQAVNDPTRAAKECRQVFRCGVVVVDSGATIHGLRLWEISRLPLWLPRKGAAATIRISLENLGNAEFCIYIYICFFHVFPGFFWFEFACPSLLGHSPGDTTRTVCLNLLVSQTCSVLSVDIGGNIFYIIPKQRNMSNFLGSETSQMRHAHH